ncbi:hypothetical protein DQP58_08150 [Mycobacterium colombiense]|uniref:Uncharacterized protein n=1 Tax=Mycobacterium colombiense TaxID=339268 RepID=A0A329KN21_9MYCO|nr:hypothetical protein DQP58_08150 [Mycobacterium colombiense]
MSCLVTLYCPIHEITPGPGTFDVDALAHGKVRFIASLCGSQPRPVRSSSASPSITSGAMSW